MKISDYRLGFIGFGHMAQVIFKAIQLAKLIPRSSIHFIQRDAHKMKENEKEFGITSTSLKNLVEKSDLLILGVRPFQAEAVLDELKSLNLDPSKMLITVLAGIQIAYYRKKLKNPILRVMPNIASEVGEGMSVFSYSSNAPSLFRSLTHLLFSCMGDVIEVPEEMMDVSCGIAGSGPGFVFRLIDAMAKAGVKEGLPASEALRMAAQTFRGAASLVLKKKDIARLLLQIATPNGTTEAGLKVMNETKLDALFQSAIEASSKRSKELSKEFL